MDFILSISILFYKKINNFFYVFSFLYSTIMDSPLKISPLESITRSLSINNNKKTIFSRQNDVRFPSLILFDRIEHEIIPSTLISIVETLRCDNTLYYYMRRVRNLLFILKQYTHIFTNRVIKIAK